MNRRSLYSLGVALLASVLTGPSGGAALRARVPSLAGPDDFQSSTGLNSIVAADFDGDRKPDVIVRTAAGRGYTLQIQFSTQIPSTSLAFDGAVPGMRIVSSDVNRDNDEDLVVTSCTSPIPIAVFLGDGKGHFQPDNPWNYIPVGLNSPYHYDSPAGHEGPAGNTEDKRSPVPALCGILTDLRLDLHIFLSRGNADPGVRTAGFSQTLRGPPAELNL